MKCHLFPVQPAAVALVTKLIEICRSLTFMKFKRKEMFCNSLLPSFNRSQLTFYWRMEKHYLSLASNDIYRPLIILWEELSPSEKLPSILAWFFPADNSWERKISYAAEEEESVRNWSTQNKPRESETDTECTNALLGTVLLAPRWQHAQSIRGAGWKPETPTKIIYKHDSVCAAYYSELDVLFECKKLRLLKFKRQAQVK